MLRKGSSKLLTKVLKIKKIESNKSTLNSKPIIHILDNFCGILLLK